MAVTFYTDNGSDARLEAAVGDIQDLIFNIDRDETPLLATLPRRTIQDINPKTVSDALAAASKTNFHAQGATAIAAVDQQRSLIQNNTQIFMQTADTSTTQNAVKQYGMGAEHDYQVAIKMRQIGMDMETTLVSDQATQAATTTNTNIGKMAGMSNIIATTTTAVGSFSQAAFNSDLATVYAAGGKPNMAYMDYTHKALIAAWTSNVVRNMDDPRKVIVNVQFYESALGPVVQMLWHHLMPADIVSSAAHVLVIQPDLWEVLVLRTQELRRVKLAITGLSMATMVTGEYSVLCGAEQGNFQYY